MDWVDVMVEEHGLITRLSISFKNKAREFQAGQVAEAEFASFSREAAVLMREFADKCHHAKEEQHLFPLLERHGRGDEVRFLLSDHEKARATTRGIFDLLGRFENGEKPALAKVAESAIDYNVLISRHILRENVEFRKFDSEFSKEEHDRLLEKFEKTEAEEIGEGKHEDYEKRILVLAGPGAR